MTLAYDPVTDEEFKEMIKSLGLDKDTLNFILNEQSEEEEEDDDYDDDEDE